jgi:superfamily II DNA/RNA helicase
MFSATFDSKVMSLATRLTKQAGRIELAHAGDVHANIAQKLHWADNMAHKHRLLAHLLSDPELDQAVVFASTQVESEKIADTLRANGYEASALHGAMPQAVRMRRLDSLRKGHTKILVATDVAARGIDVPRISHVINFGLPMKPEDYTHRIGRTGRAGRNGTAITLVEHRDRVKIRAIERFTQQDIPSSVIAGLEPTANPNAGSGRPGGGRGRSGGGGGGGRPGGRTGAGGGRSGGSGAYAGKTGGGYAGKTSSGGYAARSESGSNSRPDSRAARPSDNRTGPKFAKPKSGGPRKSYSSS